MGRFALVWSWVLYVAAAQAHVTGLSAYRAPGSSYLGYKATVQLFNSRIRGSNYVSPMEIAGTDRSKLAAATKWEDQGVLVERFDRLRDTRFLKTSDQPNFPRRSSWLYPDDGCFARAALAVRNLVQWSAAAPKKIFAFGDLAVKTNNAPGGEVTWWYHVAPVVEIGGQRLVLDPAIEPDRPLGLEDWVARMSDHPETVELAVCESGTYTATDDCQRATDGIEAAAENEQVGFLSMEWRRLVDLQRNPQEELGEHPPWLH